ncbi:RecU [Staphylococcus aureus]|nr:RecU [Staphylococcus aureus]
MNYPNGKPYRKNSAIDGGKKTAAFSNIEYGGRGMSLEKDIEHSNAFYLKATLQLFTKSLRQYK